MDRDRERMALRLLAEAVERREDSRVALLDRAGIDDAMRREIDALLAAHAQASRFLVPPSMAQRDSMVHEGQGPSEDIEALEASHVPESIAGFRLLRVLGRGGMGVVYLAEQHSLGRRVALKLLTGAHAPGESTRFHLESEALARLAHPGVAMVLETGVEGTGPRSIAWLAMELVDGATPITEHAATTGLDRRQRLELFASVCDAVHHGHQKGVIHRDLKPANILVDAAGRAKVIDFGIARLFDRDRKRPRLTERGSMLGTPAFMSPEQFNGGADAVDVRIDVYALGAVLYELLCGVPAFDVADLPLPSAIEIVRTREAVRPRLLDRTMPRDLETIMLAALEKDPRRRYPSVAALAEDLRRLLRDRPIEARPSSKIHRFRLFWKRHRSVATVTALASVAVVVATVVSILSAIGARRAEVEASRRRDEAEYRSYVAAMAAAESALASREYSRLRTNLEAAPVAHRGWEWDHLAARSETAEIVVRADSRRVHAVAMAPDGRSLWSAGCDGTLCRWDPETGAPLEVRPRHVSIIVAMEISPDGSLIASGALDGTISLESTAVELECVDDGSPSSPSPPGSDDDVVSRESPEAAFAGAAGIQPRPLHAFSVTPAIGIDFSFSEDGAHLACGGTDGRVRIWRTCDGALIAEFSRPGPVRAVLFAGPRSIVVAGERQDVEVIDFIVGSSSRVLAMTSAAQDDEDDRDRREDRAASDGQAARAGSWDASAPHAGQVTDLAWLDAPDSTAPGRTLLVALRDPHGRPDARIVAMSIDGEGATAAPQVHERFRIEETGRTWAIAVHPDGDRFATSGGDMHVHLWDAQTGQEIRAFGGHAENVRTLAFTVDGDALWSGGWDGTLRRWDLRSLDRRRADVPVLEGHEDTIQAVAFAPTGPLVASAGRDGRICIWNRHERTLRHSWRASDGIVWSLAFSPDGTRLISGLHDGTVVIWDVERGERMETLKGHAERVYGVAVSSDGQRIASASLDRTARVWVRDSSGTWGLEHVIEHDARVWCVAFAPLPDAHDSEVELLASASWDRTVRLTSIGRTTGSELGSGAASGNGSGNRSGTGLRTSTASTVAVLTGHSDGIYGLAFSPDGLTLASGGRDRRVILWDVATRRERRRLEDHGQFITGLAFLPDGSRLVGATWWGRTMLWDPRTGATLVALRGAVDDSARAMGVSADGEVIASAGREGVVWLWERRLRRAEVGWE